jgi:hypothetical protein
MQPRLTAVALWTCFSALALSACEPKRIVTNLAPPPERLQCVAAGARPKIPAEYVIDWSKVATVAQAQAEHQKYVASIRTREGVIAGYILDVEGKLFACSNNATWLRDWYAKTAAK